MVRVSVTPRGPDAGTGYVTLCYSDTSQATPDTADFLSSPVSQGENLIVGEEDFVSKVLVLLWDDRVFVDELEWTKSIEKYFSQ